MYIGNQSLNPSNQNLNQSSGGTITLVLKNVDAMATTATSLLANGFVELTVIWEWIPNAVSGTGLATAPKAPMPFNTQQVLSTISDLGAFLFEGARAVSGGAPGLIEAGARIGVRYLTGGVSEARQRGSAMPQITAY